MLQIAGNLQANLENLKGKHGEWKSKLSGAFTSEQLFFSLAILSVFYIGYVTFNGYSDVSTKHEGNILDSCYCKHSHQHFYRAWFISGCIVWAALLTYSYIGVRFPSLENLPNVVIYISKYLFKKCKHLLRCCRKKCCKHTDDNYTIATDESQPDPGGSKSGGKGSRYTEVLWFQYYNLHVTGYAKGDDEKIVLDANISNDDHESVEPVTVSHDIDNSDDKIMVPCFCCIAYIGETKDSQAVRENCSCKCDESIGICVSVLKSMNNILLLLIKFLAQLVTLPLLLLQIFNTYSLLCFSPNLFCETSTDNKIHLAQAAISILFYFSLALSQLASTMLNWNPWPQKVDKDTEAAAS